MVDLAELRKLHEAATPGEWTRRGFDNAQTCILGPKQADGNPLVGTHSGPAKDDNVALIVATRNALPVLLDAAFWVLKRAMHSHDCKGGCTCGLDQQREKLNG